MDIRVIAPQMTYAIRSRLLLCSSDPDEFQMDGDFYKESFHLGAYVESSLAGVASFILRECSGLDHPQQYMLCALGVLKQYREAGIASNLMEAGFHILREKGASMAWCNVPTEHQAFMEKLGFAKLRDSAEGTSLIMYRADD